MKKFFSVLLSIVFAIMLLATLLLSVVRSNLNYSKIAGIAGKFLDPVLEYYLSEEDVKFDSDFVQDVLNCEELCDFVDKYAGKVLAYATDSITELNFAEDDLKKVADKGIELYVKHTGAYVDKSNLDNQIKEYTAQIISDLDKLKEENPLYISVLKKAVFFLSLKGYLICIICSLLLACLLFLINRNIFVWLQYVFMPAFVDGIILFVVAVGLKVTLPKLLTLAIKNAGIVDGIADAIWAYLSIILNQIKICGAVSAIAGIALWAFGFTLGKKKSA